MRFLYIILILFLLLTMQSEAQEQVNGFEFKYSMIRVARQNDYYSFSFDPTFEAFYFSSVSKRIIVSGGLMVQTGKQSWDAFTGHTINPPGGTPLPLRANYDRRYKYICIGVPLKIERVFLKSLFNSFYSEFTAGRYLHIDLKDYYNFDPKYTFDIGYHGLFWDVQLGLTKDINRIRNITPAVSALAGLRNQQLDGYVDRLNLTNYFYYGLGLTIRIIK